MRGWMAGMVGGLTLLATGTARAEVDPKCEGLPIPDDYDEQVQQDFQQNYFALSTSFSPVHGAVPHEPGRGSLGVHVGVIPALGCEKRFVLNWTKTEDTNKSPVIPRITGSYAFPAIADIVVPYAEVGLLPPVPINGTRNLVVSGAFGLGVMAHEFFDVGARFHLTSMRTYGDVATAFDPETEPVVEDVFVASTWGVDALMSVPLDVGAQRISPFVSVGYLNASTFFFVGDSSYVANNLHPYSGMALSVGLDTLLVDRLRLAGEFHAAPGGYSLPDPEADSVDRASRYGNLFTARFHVAYEF